MKYIDEFRNLKIAEKLYRLINEEARGLRQVNFNQKEYSKAIEVLQEIIEKYPKSSYVAQSKLLIADCYEKMEDYAKAISQYEEIAKNYPKEEQKQSALSKIGMLYTAMRDYKNAVESYEKIITKYPGTLVAKVAKYQIRVIKEYYEKGLEPSVEELQKISKEEGF